MTTIKDSIMKQIESGVIEMRPRWHFVVKAGLIFSLMVIGMLFLVYVMNFIVFMLVSSGAVLMPLFGVKGLLEFLHEVPWILALATLSLFVFLYVLVKRFAFAYRKPVLLVVSLMLLTTAVLSIFVYVSPLNQALENRVVAGYRGAPAQLHVWYGSLPKRITEGQVVHIGVGYFDLIDNEDRAVIVDIAPETRLPLRPLEVGDWVVVLGPRHEGVIEAMGVKKYRH